MSQPAFIETAVDRLGVDVESDIPASQTADVGPIR